MSDPDVMGPSGPEGFEYRDPSESRVRVTRPSHASESRVRVLHSGTPRLGRASNGPAYLGRFVRTLSRSDACAANSELWGDWIPDPSSLTIVTEPPS